MAGEASSTRIRERVRRLHLENNYLNNRLPQVGGGCEFLAYTGMRQTWIFGKIII